jgi:hypothetical protein
MHTVLFKVSQQYLLDGVMMISHLAKHLLEGIDPAGTLLLSFSRRERDFGSDGYRE